MKKMFHPVILAIGFLSVTFTQSCQSTKSSTSARMLKFDPEKDKSYDYEMITNFDQEIAGQTMSMDMTAYYTMKVENDDGETKNVSMTYERFRMSTQMAGMNIEIDSDKPITVTDTSDEKQKGMAMVSNMFAKLKGKEFKMKVNAEGKVLEVTGMKELGKSLVESMDLQDRTPEEKEQMMSQFTEQFNDEDAKGQFERILYIFPNKEVKVGDTWERNTTAKTANMPLTYNSTYTVKEIEGDMVMLEEKSKIKSSKDNMNMDGNVKGTLTIDSRSGLMVSADQDYEMKVSGQGVSVNLKGKGKVRGKAN